MPFDGAENSQALEKMDQVIRMLVKPDRWCKGTASTHDGRHCIMGALNAVRARWLLQPAIMRAIADVSGCRLGIEPFNDSRHTDHALVLKVLKKAREYVASGRFVTMTEEHEPLPAWDQTSDWLFRFWQ